MIFIIWSELKKLLTNLDNFLSALAAFLKLYRAGFSISNHANPVIEGFEINRFFWKNKIIREMPDIDLVDGRYTTVFNGHVERLP